MIRLEKNKFSLLQWLFFSVNFIVGFGFIATLTDIIKTGSYSLISFAIASFISLAVMLVYARASVKHGNIDGAAYGYAKLLNNKHWSFFNGWNQLSQIILLSSATPLFLTSILDDNVSKEYHNYWLLASVLFFVLIVASALFGIKFSKWLVFVFSALKWITIIGGILIVVYFSFRDHQYHTNFFYRDPNISVSLITLNSMSFIYAYEGFGQLANANNDVKTKKFKPLLVGAFFAIFIFYLISYILFMGIKDAPNIGGFAGVWKKAFFLTGTIVFLVGTVGNKIQSNISGVVIYARMVFPMAEDLHLPYSLRKQNRFGEFGRAIYLVVFITILTMVLFSILPTLLNLKNQFSTIIQAGTIVYLMNYLGMFITYLLLHHYKTVIQIPVWEQIIYVLAMAMTIFVLLASMIPPIVGEPWTLQNSVMLGSYLASLAFGYLVWFFTWLYYRYHPIVRETPQIPHNDDEDQAERVLEPEAVKLTNLIRSMND